MKKSEVNELTLLQEKLKSVDKVAVDVQADGNCLFASLSHQLHRLDVPVVRSEIVKYLTDHKEEFNEDFRLDVLRDEDSYRNRMSVDGI